MPGHFSNPLTVFDSATLCSSKFLKPATCWVKVMVPSISSVFIYWSLISGLGEIRSMHDHGQDSGFSWYFAIKWSTFTHLCLQHEQQEWQSSSETSWKGRKRNAKCKMNNQKAKNQDIQTWYLYQYKLKFETNYIILIRKYYNRFR